jgi:hypothetical protein
MPNRSIDIIGACGTCEDNQKMEGPLATHGELYPWKYCRHREALLGSFSRQRIELGFEVSIPVNAVMIGERNEVEPFSIATSSAGIYKRLGNLR